MNYKPANETTPRPVLLAKAVPTPPRNPRRGDAYGRGIRTVKHGRVRWGGLWYAPVPPPMYGPYDGRFEGKRIFFKQAFNEGMMSLLIIELYDEPTPVANPYYKWVCDEFDT